MAEAVLDRLRAWQPEFAALRQDIHAHPELGLEETRTAGLVADKLRSYGIDVTEGVGVTGVVGVLRGRRDPQSNAARSVGLRADMDALALTELTGLPYASQNAGRMHACGHDGHTTMLLAAARYLAEDPDFTGTVNFIFQPAEEGRGGAEAMMRDGLFERFPCDAVYGLHTSPGQPVGTVASRIGPMMAAGGNWTVTFTGTGGHGGFTPHLATDATMALGQFLMGVQTVVSRNVAPGATAVISVGHITAGSPEALNVMPSRVQVAGTMRCFDPKVRTTIDERIAALATTLAAAHGCTAETTMHWLMPTLVNHAEQTGLALAAAGEVFGPGNVNPDFPAVTGGEDFAYMLEKRPGAFVFLGNGAAADGSYHAVHTPHFNFNDDAIPDGAAYWVSLVRQELAPG